MVTTRSNLHTLIKHTMTWLTLEVTAEKKPGLRCQRGKRNVFSKCCSGSRLCFEAAELDTIALLADTWDNDLDPGVRARVQAKVQTYLSFGKQKGKGEGKGKGKFPACPSCSQVQERRLTAKTECRACGRKRHWAQDRECAMSHPVCLQQPRRIQLV